MCSGRKQAAKPTIKADNSIQKSVGASAEYIPLRQSEGNSIQRLFGERRGRGGGQYGVMGNVANWRNIRRGHKRGKPPTSATQLYAKSVHPAPNFPNNPSGTGTSTGGLFGNGRNTLSEILNPEHPGMATQLAAYKRRVVPGGDTGTQI